MTNLTMSLKPITTPTIEDTRRGAHQRSRVPVRPDLRRVSFVPLLLDEPAVGGSSAISQVTPGRRTLPRFCSRLSASSLSRHSDVATMGSRIGGGKMGGNGAGLTVDWAGDSTTVLVAVFPSHTSRDAPDIVLFLLEFIVRNLNGVSKLDPDSLRSRVLGFAGGAGIEFKGLLLDFD